MQSHNLEVVDPLWNGNVFSFLLTVLILLAHGVPKVLWNFCLQFKSIPRRFFFIKKKKVLCFYFLHSSYSCIIGNASSRPGDMVPEAAIRNLGRITDFTFTAYFAEIFYSSLTKYRFDEYHDIAASWFMFLLLQKLIVTPLHLVFLSIIICHIQYVFFLRQQFTFRSSSWENLIFHNFFLVFITFISNNWKCSESCIWVCSFFFTFLPKPSAPFCCPWYSVFILVNNYRISFQRDYL